MIQKSLIPRIGYRIFGYKSEQCFSFPHTMPLSLTVSITQKCNSRCKTCNIWKDKNSDARGVELTTKEYESIFKSLGRSVIWYTLSGGEPFLRKDIIQIVRLIKEYSNPAVINIPTNAILTNRIFGSIKEILPFLYPDTTLIVNLSLDGIGDKHDEIRDIKGNYTHFLETYKKLKTLKECYPSNFEIGIHSVVSKFNVELLPELFEHTKTSLAPDSYISEIAENREELLNMNDDITPSVDKYEKTIRFLQQEVRKCLLKNSGITGLIQAFRLKYYDYVIEEIREKKRIIPCYAGRVSTHISPWGDVWPCSILAYKADMGNLREYNLDFKKLWYSTKAVDIKKQVRNGTCYCPVANIHYTNMLLTPASLFHVTKTFLSSRISN